MSKRTYHGSCHCRRIQFEADIDLTTNPTTKCNCTICWKLRWWGTIVKPEAFRLVTAPEDVQYGFPTESNGKRVLCKTCGVTAFGWGHLKEIGGDYVSINVAALDDLATAELLAAPLQYLDGRNDNWWNGPSETRHL